MIRWFDELYMDEKAAKHPKRYRKRVESDKILKKHCMVISLASNPENLFDIFDTKELYFRYNKKREIYIVGLAAEYDQAVELLEEIIEDMYQQQQEFLPRDFFSKDKFN